MTVFSILDLATIPRGATVGQALTRSLELARHAEALGYRRFWMAEHHGMENVASSATAVALAHVAAGTSTIRVGAGGIMLPNHAPLTIVEQFGTLAALHPGRIDLGLGRAPGSDMRVARALRRTLNSDPNEFPRDVMEIQALFRGDPEMGFIAVPGAGEKVPLWILGSSLFGAQLAALLGLPFAFASHFAPDHLDEALALYRRDFRPSEQLAKPHAMAAMGLYVAETDEDARLLASSMEQVFVQLRTTGRTSPLAPPVPGYRESLPPQVRAMLDNVLSCAAIGSPERARAQIERFIARTGADEIIFSGAMFDFEAQRRSLTLTAAVCQSLMSTDLVSV